MDRHSQKLKPKRFHPTLLTTIAATVLSLRPQTALASPVEEASLFGEIAGGYTHIDPGSRAETKKNGYHLLLTAFGEVATDNWVLQAGGGFFYNRIYSSGEKQFPGEIANTVKQQKNVRIETRAGDFEIAARYRITSVLEAGLLVRTLFGTSLSFSQDHDEATKFFAGPQVVYRMARDSDYLRRLDVSLTTDLNVPFRRVYLLTAGFALGRTFKFPKEPAVPAPMPAPTSAPVVEDRYEEILADKIINFKSGSSEVTGPALGFLKELGAFLQKSPELFKEIDVEGHTDANGKLAYNMKLSKDRANAVRTVLIAAGAPSVKVKAEGFGPTRPLVKEDSAEARATNRRVVMAFNVVGHDQRNALSRKIKELRMKYFGE
ncbi:MAG: OmpA family protein [Chitinophagaceae bacterium]|nr:OmpA family protein [Oligoflexus sp.]